MGPLTHLARLRRGSGDCVGPVIAVLGALGLIAMGFLVILETARPMGPETWLGGEHDEPDNL